MPWDGTFNGEPLPVASYYFIIEYNDNTTPKSNGIVSIIKQKKPPRKEAFNIPIKDRIYLTINFCVFKCL